MDEKTTAVGILAVGFVATILVFALGASLGLLTPVLILVLIISCPASLITYKYGYWMIPYFTRQMRVIRTQDASADVPPTEDVLVKEEGGYYSATIFLGVKIYKTSTAMSEDEKFSFMKLWERAVSGTKSVIKFGTLVYVKDLSKYRDGIEARKAKAQMLLGQEREKDKPSQPAIEKLEREIAMWDNMQEKVMLGEKPTAILDFIQVSATGGTRDSAIGAARTRANELRSTVGTALNVEVAPMSGEDMKRCFDWAYTLPPGLKEL